MNCIIVADKVITKILLLLLAELPRAKRSTIGNKIW